MWPSNREHPMPMKALLRYLIIPLCLIATSDCSHVMADDEDAAFEYREIYLPENQTKEGERLGLNNVDRDWGLWGHKLSRVLPERHSRSVYATIGGTSNDEQFCFSSNQLFHYIEDYIVDNYGERHTSRFAILPNDNRLVCQCAQCVAKGCTDTDAAPAVFDMIRRLAERFPNHQFFTSQYMSTRSQPRHPMPANTGVLVSAIRYRLTAVPSPREEEFTNTLKLWTQVTPNVYVWDYINNFDDYFTPYPIFTVMQRRLRLYAKAGVRGVFLNGSGHDYSSFSRLHTHVLSALLHDPDTDWRSLLLQKSREFYPVTGDVVAHFLMRLEDKVQKYEGVLPIYDGVGAALRGYLDGPDFIAFHNALGQMLARTSGAEHEEISLLHRTLMLTHLELKRLNGDISKAEPMLQQLESVADDDVRIYSESFWTIDSYVADYRAMCAQAPEARKNKLLGQSVVAVTKLDEEYTDLSILTDGLISLPSNYHCGQLISSADPWLRLAIPNPGGLRRVRVGFTNNVQFHIALPLRVTLSCNGRDIATVQPQSQGSIAQRATAEFAIPSWAQGSLLLTIVRNKEERTMAIDEIEGY